MPGSRELSRAKIRGDASKHEVIAGTLSHLSCGTPRGGRGCRGSRDVTNAGLAFAAIWNNLNAAAALDAIFAHDPPALADIEVLSADVNERIPAPGRWDGDSGDGKARGTALLQR
jgi:hypothetical protein